MEQFGFDQDIFDSGDEFFMEESDDDDEDYHDPGSDDDQSCPICLNDFDKQQIALPDNCRHVFCVDCILEWSKKSNSCPVDRIKFHILRVYHRFAGLFNREVAIQEAAYDSDDAYEIETLCEICNRGDNEETLLLCDGCDLGFHCGCLTPALDEVPSGEWFCNRCKEERRETSSIAQRRLVGRTNLSERVRSRVSQTRRRHAEAYTTLDEQLDAIVDEILRNAAHRFRETTPSRRQNSSKKPSTRRRTRRRRKGRHGRSRSNKRETGDKVKQTSFSKDDVRSMHKFTLTGRSNDLSEFSSGCADPEVPSHVVAQRHRILTQSALQFNQPLPSLFSLHAEASSSFPPMSPPPPMPDLLSSILTGQNLLFTPSSQVTIQRGGNLVLNEPKPPKEWNIPEKSQTTAKPSILPPPLSAFAESNSVPNKPMNEKSIAVAVSKEIKPVPAPEKDFVPKKPINEESIAVAESKEIKPVPAPGSSVEDSSKSILTRTSVTSNTAKPSIMIKPIFSLPTSRKSATSEDDVYDPFRPTESDDDMEISGEESEAEKSVAKEEETSDESLTAATSEIVEALAVEKELDAAELVEEVKEENVKSVEKESAKKPDESLSLDEEFEIDIFAEEELEKAQAEAARKTAEMPDPLKLWRDEVRQSTLAEEESQVVLPALELKSSPASTPMKFKKRSRKDVEEDGKSHYRSRKESSKNDNEDKSNRKKKSSKKASKTSERKGSKKKEKSPKVRNEKPSKPYSDESPTKNISVVKPEELQHYQKDKPRKRSVTIKHSSPVSDYRYLVTSPKKHQNNPPSTGFYASSGAFEADARRKRYSADQDHSISKDHKRKRRDSETDHQRESSRKDNERAELTRDQKRKKREEKSSRVTSVSRTRTDRRKLNENLLWSVKSISDRHSNVLDSSKSSTRKTDHSHHNDMHEKNSETKRSKKHRSSSSESGKEKRKRKKKKRARSKSPDSERKKIKKKKKHSRSPKKKKGRQEPQKDATEKSIDLAFEHLIFADFDDSKQTKKRKETHRKASSERVSTEFEEEEISVIYEYQSLSEGEIISSDDEASRKRIINSSSNAASQSSHTSRQNKSSPSRSPLIYQDSLTDKPRVSSIVVQVENKPLPEIKSSLPLEIDAPSSVIDIFEDTSKDQTVETEFEEKEKMTDFSSTKRSSPAVPETIVESEQSSLAVHISYENVEIQEVFEEGEALNSPVTVEKSIKSPLKNPVAPENTVQPFSESSKLSNSELPVVDDPIPNERLAGSANLNAVAASPAISIEAMVDEEDEEYVSTAAGATPVDQSSEDVVAKPDSPHPQSFEPASTTEEPSQDDIKPLLHYLKSLKKPEKSVSADLSDMSSALSAQKTDGNEKDTGRNLGSMLHQVEDSHLPPLEDSALSSTRRLRTKSRDSVSRQRMLPSEKSNVPSLESSPSTEILSTERPATATVMVKPLIETPENIQMISRKFPSEVKPNLDSLLSYRSDASIPRMTARVSPITVKAKNDSQPYSPTSLSLNRERKYPHPNIEASESSRMLTSKHFPRNLSSGKTIPSEQITQKVDLRKSPSTSQQSLYPKPQSSPVTTSSKAYSSSSSKPTFAEAIEILSSFSARLQSATQTQPRPEMVTSKLPVPKKEITPSTSHSKSTPPEFKHIQKNLSFQQEVVKHAKAAIIPYFKRREVSKEQYKGIMKKAVNKPNNLKKIPTSVNLPAKTNLEAAYGLTVEIHNLKLASIFAVFKICRESRVKKAQPEKIHRLVKKYVKNCLLINEQNKEQMRSLLDSKVNKDVKKRLREDLEFSTSPPSPVDDS